jgi:uncharacterized protein (TIGR02001 family)
MTKLRIVCAAAALAAMASGNTLAETTANIGYMSDYIFRGAYQSESTAFGGLDVEGDSGAYFGVWGANVNQGLEYDIYAGYAGGGENFQWYAGVTGYYYTDEFDDSYEEVNLGFTYGFLTFDYAVGYYEVAKSSSLPANAKEEQTYEYFGLTFAPEVGPYYFLGNTDYHALGHDPATNANWGHIPGTNRSGYWFEIGKAFEIMEDLEFAIAALYSGDVQQYPSQTPSSIRLGRDPIVISPGVENTEYALTFTLTKTFQLGN